MTSGRSECEKDGKIAAAVFGVRVPDLVIGGFFVPFSKLKQRLPMTETECAKAETDSVDLIGVVVTTAHRGVFFGFADPQDVEAKAKIRLKRAKNCIYWNRSIGGFLGLAAVGPDSECRIGKEAPEIVLHDITSVSLCTEEAVASWAKA